MNWLERAEREIDEDYERGNMTDKEYSYAMRDLYQEYEEFRQEAAQAAYENY